MHAFPHSDIARIMMHLASYNPWGLGQSWDLAALHVPTKTWSSIHLLYVSCWYYLCSV